MYSYSFSYFLFVFFVWGRGICIFRTEMCSFQIKRINTAWFKLPIVSMTAHVITIRFNVFLFSRVMTYIQYLLSIISTFKKIARNNLKKKHEILFLNYLTQNSLYTVIIIRFFDLIVISYITKIPWNSFESYQIEFVKFYRSYDVEYDVLLNLKKILAYQQITDIEHILDGLRNYWMPYEVLIIHFNNFKKVWIFLKELKSYACLDHPY